MRQLVWLSRRPKDLSVGLVLEFGIGVGFYMAKSLTAYPHFWRIALPLDVGYFHE